MAESFVARIARFLLIVIAISWLAPEFSWAAHADHDELAHDATSVDHDHPGGDAGHDHRDAHSSLGHVLGHLPVAPSAPVVLGLESPSVAPLLQIQTMQRSAVLARLDRPPRFFFPG